MTEDATDETGVFHQILQLDDSRLAEVFARAPGDSDPSPAKGTPVRGPARNVVFRQKAVISLEK